MSRLNPFNYFGCIYDSLSIGELFQQIAEDFGKSEGITAEGASAQSMNSICALFLCLFDGSFSLVGGNGQGQVDLLEPAQSRGSCCPMS